MAGTMTEEQAMNNGDAKGEALVAKEEAIMATDMESGMAVATMATRAGEETEKAKEVHTEEDEESNIENAEEARQDAKRMDGGLAEVITMQINAHRVLEMEENKRW